MFSVCVTVGPGGWWSSSAHMSLSVWKVGEISEGGEGGVSHGARTGVQQLCRQLVRHCYLVR